MFSSNMDCFFFFLIIYFWENSRHLLLVEVLQRKLYRAESLEVNKCPLKGLKRFRSGSNRDGQVRAIFNYVFLCLFTELFKADYNSKFHPSIKNPKQSNPDIKNGPLLMAKNVNFLCWALFQDALLELSTCGK